MRPRLLANHLKMLPRMFRPIERLTFCPKQSGGPFSLGRPFFSFKGHSMLYADALPDPEYQSEFYQGVPLKRGMAWVVDTILTLILTAIIVPFTAFTALFFLPLLYLLVNTAYRWISLSSSSATPGMRLVAVEFRRADGRAFDGATAFLHTMGYLVSMAFVLPQILSVVMMLLSPKGQGLTDTVLGSVAINKTARY